MAANLSANKILTHRIFLSGADGKEPTERYDVAQTVIYRGAMVALNTSKYLEPAANTSGFKFVGVAQEEVDNSAGSAGDETCLVLSYADYWSIYCTHTTTLTKALVEEAQLYMYNTTTVAISTGVATQSIKCGIGKKLISATTQTIRARLIPTASW